MGRIASAMDDLTAKSFNSSMQAYDVTECVDSFTVNAQGKAQETPTYDAAGNLTYDGVQCYTYDAWNRLVKVAHGYRDATGVHSGATMSTSSYDGRGRRISKAVSGTGSLDCTYHYYYDQDSMIETRNGSDMVLKQQVWGLTYVDELVQTSINSDPTADNTCETPYWVCQDANYNVLGLVDFAGTLKERYEYTPYGERTVFFSPGSNDPYLMASTTMSRRIPYAGGATQPYGLNEFGHQGLYHDEEVGLIYNRARQLHPTLGRFMQRDPLGYVDGMSAYEYERTGPVTSGDFTGLEFIDQGRVGQSTLWWFGGKAGMGLQNIGSIQKEVAPEIVVTKKKGGIVCAHVKKDTGTARVVRGYTGTQAGDQGIGATGSPYAGVRGYVSNKLAAALDAHEQGHVDASEAIFNSTLAVAEAEAKAYWTKEICCCPTREDPTEPSDVLKSRIAWDHWKGEFARLDHAVNGASGTFHAWETAQGGGPTAYSGAGVIGGVSYGMILRSREETDAHYALPNYGTFSPASPNAPAKPLTCSK